MQMGHQLWKLFEIEIDGSRPGIEASSESKVNCVGSVLNSRMDAVPVSRRGQQLGRRRPLGRCRSHFRSP